MRRSIVLILALILGTAAITSAQENTSSAFDAEKHQTETPDGIPVESAPGHMITGIWEPVQLEKLDQAPNIREPEDLPATDFCVGSPNLTLRPGDGGQTVTNPMTESAGDPALTCAWNKPDDFTGYRTVWYRFTAESDGYVTIVTSGSTYDTILSVYQGSCGLKIPVACNDDYNGFASQVKIPVNAGLTYYVEVADWHFGVSGQATLDLGAWITTYNRWDEVANMDVPRSRHASAISGDLIYIIGGQTIVSSIPSRTPAVSTYYTNTSTWTSLSTLPGPDGFGYSNTTAALVNGKIYLPSGYVGVDSLYDSTHWVYDIATNQWSTSVPNNWADSEPAIYSTAQPYSSTSIPAGYFLVGGLTGSIPLPVQQPPPDWQARDEMYYYVPSLNFWFQRTPMNTGRFGHTSALQNIGGTDHLCVVGGIGSGIGNIPVVLSQGECYNIVTEQWSIVTGPLNYPRYYAASGIDQDGNWIVYGGINHLGQNVAPTEVYNRETNQWEILNAFSSLGAVDEETSPPRAWPRAGFV
ncbi:MAG: Kelch repeat-containing protein, partial [Candidatus Promineifilaceae bacterium]